MSDAKVCPKGTMLINRKCFIPKWKIQEHWSKGKPYTYRDTTYRVGKMSYGDYFLEPFSKKTYGETEGFHPETLWLMQVSGKEFSQFLQVEE